MSRPERYVITRAELDQLVGVPDIVFRLYLVLLQLRDFASGVVGDRRGISWLALAEEMEVEPHPGIKRHKPGKDQLRRAAGWLERRGLAVNRSNARQWQLIFFLPLAHRHQNFAPNKAAINPPRKAASGAQREKDDKAALPTMAKAATHQGSVKHNNGAEAVDSSAADLIHPASATPAERALWNGMLRKGSVNGSAQSILDELAGSWSAVRNRGGFVAKLIELDQRGAFVPSKGVAIAEERAKRAQEERSRDAEASMPPPASRDAARAGIAAAKANITASKKRGKHERD